MRAETTLPSFKSECFTPEACRCSNWVPDFRISSRVANCMTCTRRNPPVSSSLGGYNLDVDALDIVQAMQMIMNNPGRLELRQTWRRVTAEFARPSVASLIFLNFPPLEQVQHRCECYRDETGESTAILSS